jgi:hypothetical protein
MLPPCMQSTRCRPQILLLLRLAPTLLRVDSIGLDDHRYHRLRLPFIQALELVDLLV